MRSAAEQLAHGDAASERSRGLRSRLARGLRYVADALALALLGAVVLAASAWLHLHQAVGRRAFGDALGAAVSSQIPGRFEVAGVREVELPRVRAGHVIARTAGGHEVMDLRDVTVDLDLAASIRNRGFLARSVRVGAGSLEIADAPTGGLSIERAFDDGAPAPAGPPPPHTWLLRLRDMRFDRLDVIANAGGQRARLRDATGRARIWLRRDGDVQMRFWSVRGRMQTSLPVLSEATIRGLALTIDPSGPELARFATRLDALGGRLTLAGHAPRRSGDGACLRLWTDGAVRASLAGVGAELFTSVGADDIDFDMRPGEPPRRPRCEEAE